ncbi:MAG TPA: phosphoglucomutase, alpha-D-glucose phosphate-specific [Halomonas campaniensis]|uniref:Phosphoglucomutase n=1 Tax=Halomonas campaniensis TaxID=213554 RepID=A0A3D0KDN5_9GAMM|nr:MULTISPECIES: phosphoglucomutase (alpha-D-glucose-1,6-bisphosphate-dependent) [unclassified Halomonas]HCA01485.1 phosphoglucomutase, alpha-D-glucose phosphate-specific [Halomonas campaniensis]
MAQQAAKDASEIGNPQRAIRFWQARANQSNVDEGASRMDAIVKAFFDETPDANIAKERVAFGTSGHRGRATDRTFNAAHIFAITQAVVDYRTEAGYQGPMFLGYDTHALSKPAWECALQVLAANKVPVFIEKDNGITATPLVSRAILQHNHINDLTAPVAALADGLIITPSHNPPEDGGIKYNPSHGGPADTEATKWIELRANAYLLRQLCDISPVPLEQALAHAQAYDFTAHYVAQLGNVVDMAAIQKANLTLGVDPMGGTALPVWQAVAEHYGLNLEVVNTSVDASFGFMPLDHDGKIRMDCSSPDAMANLLKIKDRFDLAFGNDPDADRHGIVDANGLMNPNHFLAVCVDYLIGHRPEWAETLNIGKTLVSSSMIDRVVAAHHRELYEVPVGFKWFVEGLHQGWLAFGGEESAGASLLTRDGKAWSTDKDGIALCLLAAEITAVTGKTPSEYYRSLTERFGEPFYKRVDTACTAEEKAAFKKLSANSVTETMLAGDRITAVLVNAPGNGEAIGGLKVTTDNGWFAARPSGTESLYKVYAESFKGPQHLDELIDSATTLLSSVLKG